MKDNRTTYKQKDELAEMFNNRNRSRESNPVRTQVKPVATESSQKRQPTAKPRTSGKKKKNTQLNSTIIYGAIIALAVLCVIIGIVILTSGGKKIESIAFTKGVITLKAGDSEKLTVVTKPEGAEFEVSYKSSDSSVKVDKDGTITAVSVGKAVITAESGGLSATCQVTVSAETITAIAVDKKEVEIAAGGGYKCNITTTPADVFDKDIFWQSSDENIAKVNENGEITGVAEGTATITVTDKVSGVTSSVKVTVAGELYPESMKFSEEKVTLEIGQEYHSKLVMTPGNITDKESIYYTTDLEIASVTNEGLITAKSAGTCTIEAYYARDNTVVAYLEVTVIDPFVITEKPEESSKPESAPEPGAESGTESGAESEAQKPVNGIEVIDGITYVQGILIANKTYALPSTYNPGTDDDAYNALDEMQTAAAEKGIVLFVVSGFRDYDTQEAIYNNYVSYDGKANADRYSARPGHSEHQTGLAFDLNELEESFGETREGRWLAENAHKYGFIIRYPKGKESITGYMYEPWHVRYLGKDIATKVYNSGLTLEEYLGITSQYQD